MRLDRHKNKGGGLLMLIKDTIPFDNNGAPWSAANRLHGQRTGAFSWRPVFGLSRKTDQFRLDHTQNCAPGWWCDRESSVYHLAHEMYSGILRHATIPWLCPVCLPNTSSIPAPIQLTIAMTTTHIHQL